MSISMNHEGIQREFDTLKAQLAATEVRLDAALGVCRALDHRARGCPQGEGIAAHSYVDCELLAEAALSLTPSQAASVIAERDRLREALERFAVSGNWDTYGEDVWDDGTPVFQWMNHNAIPNPCEFARKALAPPPEAT